MPLPLFFHLAIILWRKLGLARLPSTTLLVSDFWHPCSLSHRLALYLQVKDGFFSPFHSASDAQGGCFNPGEWIENASDLCTSLVD